MLKILDFFLIKSKLTYFILFFITISGIYFANKTTKEMFPPIQLDKIIITGGYGTASIASLDSLVVSDIENDVKNINDVKKIESFIQNGSFKTVLTLKKNANKDDILSKIKDIIQVQKINYPLDMVEPSARYLDINFPLMQISISSDKEKLTQLKLIAKEFKKEILNIPHISGVSIYDDNDFLYKFIFDYRKIDTLGINKQSLISNIKSLSYISPVGSIENSSQSFFISTQNGYVYIRDIAQIKYEHKDSSVLTFFNQKPSVNMSISRDKISNSIDMQKQIFTLIKTYNDKYSNISFKAYKDTTGYLINRLNVVASNLIFGVILVGLLLWRLINARTALLASIGIPFAFLLGVMFLYFVDYSINMMTLLGALIILGVIVDDAIIVGENIQRHMNMTEDKHLAIKNALKEVVAPVAVACFTTMFAFLPLLLMSGEMGEFMKMIPMAIIVLIFGSLIESFIFLPLHSKHILKVNAKELDWSRALDIYENILYKILKHKKKFLFGFYILIPLASIYLLSILKYTLFPAFDGNNLYIRGSFDINHTITDTVHNVTQIENIIIKNKEKLFINKMITLVGSRMDNRGAQEVKPNVFDITLQLHNAKPKNIFERYITPIMSIYGSQKQKIREINSHTALNKIKKQLDPLKQTLNMQELTVSTDGPGIIKHSIELEFYSTDKAKSIQALEDIKNKISKISGVIQVGDNLEKGSLDLKLFINKYGETLGITEQYLATSLKSFFSNSKFSKSLSNKGVTNITSQDINKNNIEVLKNFSISIPNTNQLVRVQDVVSFVYISNYKELYKVNGENIVYLFADVDSKQITPKEVLEQVRSTIDKHKKDNIKINMRGESEQNKQMMEEMSVSFALSIFLIFATLLIMFNSYKYSIIVLSIIPLSVIGALLGHIIMDQKMSMPSFIGIIGLAGVVINDGIVMLSFLKECKNIEDLIQRAKLRLRPVLITSITTFVGLSTLIFFASGQAKILQPIAISLGYGMIWGTILTLLYVPILASILHHFSNDKPVNIV
ncbi:Acriflavin resistance protein [hydrothermal vent metagenome]|uniref:Acriflavin resistance protein n=1 Tax=hydrothermal vent metagenome TaxID=652676 RepID=A0A3B1DRZ6_9ZZZZ